MISEVIELLGVYLGAAVLAHLFHLFGGVLSVGRHEVERQIRLFLDQYGVRWYPVFVLTVGILPRSRLVEDW